MVKFMMVIYIFFSIIVKFLVSFYPRFSGMHTKEEMRGVTLTADHLFTASDTFTSSLDTASIETS